MGTATSTTSKIPLPKTVIDIDPNKSLKLSTEPCCGTTGLIDKKLLSIASLLYKNGITDFDPFRIVSLQSLIDSGLCIPRPIWLGGYLWVFRLIFSDDLEYLPVGDVIVNAVTHLNEGFRLSYEDTGNYFPLLNDGMAWTNAVYEMDCKTPPFLDLSSGLTTSTSLFEDNNTWNKNNPINYSNNLPYISKSETNPTWTLKFTNDISIKQIDVFNREGGGFQNLAESVITIKNKSGNIVFTQNFSKGSRLLYTFTPPSNTMGNEIIIARPGTNKMLTIGKIIINKNFKSLGWYRDNNDRTLNSGDISTSDVGNIYLNTINKYKTQNKIIAQQGKASFLGESCINNLSKIKTEYDVLDKQLNTLNRNGNMIFDDIPVLLVKNSPEYTKVIPNNAWVGSAISYGWHSHARNWGALEIRGNDFSGFKNFGTVFCVGSGNNAWPIDNRKVEPQSWLSGDHYGALMTNRVYCAINPKYLVCLSETNPGNVRYSKNSTDWINNRSPGRVSAKGQWNHIFVYTSPFATFSALNDDNNSFLGGPWNQNWKFYDIRPEILSMFCCNGITKNILKTNDFDNFMDFNTYCVNISDTECKSSINKFCNTPENINKTYIDVNTNNPFSACKDLLIKNRSVAYDELVKTYANVYPNDSFSSCIKPGYTIDTAIRDDIKTYLLNNPGCADKNCIDNGYKLSNFSSECKLSGISCNANVNTSTSDKLISTTDLDCKLPVNCVLSEWKTGEWSSCDKTCGGGTQTRTNTRTIITEALNGGNACPPQSELKKVETQPCNTDLCKIDCVLSEWKTGEWSACDKPCGGGTKTRTNTRTPITQPQNGGKACESLTQTETESCNTGPCPVDCVLSQWEYGEWSVCDKPCGGGTQTRNNRRTVITQPQNGGKACESLNQTETKSCNIQECKSTDCVVSDWDYGQWTTCDKPCGGGSQTRTNTRKIITQANGGLACPSELRRVETQPCNTDACKIDCVVSDWKYGEWSNCSKPCGGGIQTQINKREIITNPQNGGASCPLDLSEIKTRSCNTMACATDCQYSDWKYSDWSACSKECGGGSKTRTATRSITTPSQNGGSCSGQLIKTETQSCNTDACETELSETQKIIAYVVLGVVGLIIVIGLIMSATRRSPQQQK